MKTHFLVSETPQKFGASIEVLCGKTLANPEAVMTVEFLQRSLPDFLNPLYHCSDCMGKLRALGFIKRKTYVYGLLEGQEVKNAQAESAA